MIVLVRLMNDNSVAKQGSFHPQFVIDVGMPIRASKLELFV
jgi:hypothetical protein